MNYAMIDCETFGLAPNSVILSIGAVTAEGAEFYLPVDITAQPGREVDLDTVKWWFTQETNPPTHGTMLLSEALIKLANWLSDENVTEVWANGSDFDFPLLVTAYKAEGLQVPWKYNNVRDYRTLSKLFPRIEREPFVGAKHNALDDAKNQMTHLKTLLEYVRVQK